jgi:hypothetical protein
MANTFLLIIVPIGSGHFTKPEIAGLKRISVDFRGTISVHLERMQTDNFM